MPLNLLDHCEFNGPALPEPFVRFELEKELGRLDLLPKTTGEEGKKLQLSWDVYRRKLRELDIRGGPLRVRHCVLDPLVERLGFARSESAPEVETREGQEDGGYVLTSADGSTRLRTWTKEFDEDLDAPARRGAAYRFSHLRIAQRVLLAAGERIGLLTNGVQLRVLISDPARPDSEVVIRIQSAWKPYRDAPDSYRFLLALCQPKGVVAVPDLVEKARLQQARVTKDLRLQARRAVEHFVQEVLDHPANSAVLSQYEDREKLAKSLWHEGLVLVYRLLFILKLESTDDPARSFSFASSSLWRNTFSPGVALAVRVRDVLDRGEETGRFLEDALRRLFEMFSKGLECSELHIKPLGGALFGPEAAPLLDNPALTWGERAVAFLLDQLLWTQPKRGGITRQRVHYGALDVEDLGRVYEALLELEAGIATERLCRLRRQKLEVVVPVAQGEKYRPVAAVVLTDDAEEDLAEAEAEDESEEETASSGKKTKIEWIEEIPPNRFYLRVGLGRKASGSYYTPHSFVRFLVQETLGPLCAARSPQGDPNPGEILKLKVLDPAMGSGHFLVETCRFLAEKIYEACRLCDERADPAERRAEYAIDDTVKSDALAEATKWRRRVLDLLDSNGEILQYLPSRAPEGVESGLSQRRAIALCRRLVAVHCLYGVDKNRLAVELAKLSLWIESHGEGLPLTFLDHRLVEGDSLTGPFFEHLLTYPNTGEPLEGLFADGLREKLTKALTEALHHVADLESTVGTTLSETEFKIGAKAKLDRALNRFRFIAAAWSGHVMSGEHTGVEYTHIIRAALSGAAYQNPASALDALAYDLTFPEVFYPDLNLDARGGFDAVLGNPPWDAIQFKSKEFLASYDVEVLNAATQRERLTLETSLLSNPVLGEDFFRYRNGFESKKRINDSLYKYQKVRIDGDLAGRQLDEFRVFMERNAQLLRLGGRTGVVVPSAFHANEGATGVRQLYLLQMRLECCYSFENRRKLFEIHSSFKFALVIAEAGRQTDKFSCGFYLHDDEWLFGERHRAALTFSMDFVHRTGRQYLNLMEVSSAEAASVLETLYSSKDSFADYCDSKGVFLQGPPAALHMSHESHRFVDSRTLVGEDDPRKVLDGATVPGFVVLFEGKYFWHFDDHWGEAVRYVIPYEHLVDLPNHARRAQYYQLALRKIASSTNERTIAACLLPPNTVVGDSGLVNSTIGEARTADLLSLLGLLNCYTFDWLVRQQVASNVTLFILRGIPIPVLGPLSTFVAHGALRLQCNHSGYAPLWREQLGNAWREEGSECSWPAISSDQQRWTMRATLDAIVAKAYGLSRQQYGHVLGSFNHVSCRKAPELCLDKYDEVSAMKVESFTRKYDPYWDIPLNESLPEPVIELPGVASSSTGGASFTLSSPNSAPRKGRRRR